MRREQQQQKKKPDPQKRRRNRDYPEVGEIQVIVPSGPWTTKSGSRLTVLTAHPHNARQRILGADGKPFANDCVTACGFLGYDSREVKRLTDDLRGLRVYLNDRMPERRVGGLEFHRLRWEFIFCITGSVHWVFEDLYRGIKEITLTPGHGVYLPPWILHTYHVKEDGSAVLVLCNTLFTERCTDTYTEEEFRTQQKRVHLTGETK